ncbi:glutamate--tRNA ligase [Patescibacteria group bacterium]|nr:glutamate--tRNA ligase [Patescibacteria group bacterium]
MDTKQIVTRMAPSPTGRFHVGGIRTAFYNYAFARQKGGTFILRIEDTDKERNDEAYEQEVYEVFSWLGMDYDEVYRQSEHLPRHQEVLRELIEKGLAYEAEDANDGTGKVIRFKNPNKSITFTDQILGEVTVDTTDLGDFVIARNIDSPLYHLAVVIDDHDEDVTNVIRAQEHLANTPRQILLIEALGFDLPTYAHVPFILGPDGKKKLSKRDANVAALDYRDDGYLPEALLNFLAFIGWNPGTDQEVFSKDELIKTFSLDQVQKGPGGFNLDKLAWLNKQHLNKLSDEEFANYLEPEMTPIRSLPGFDQDIWMKVLPIVRERTHSFVDVRQMIESGDLGYYFADPDLDPQAIVWKKGTVEGTITHLAKVLKMLEGYKGAWDRESLEALLYPYAEEVGKGNVLWPLRYSLSGKDKSPDPFSLLVILGPEVSKRRVQQGIELTKKAA